MQEKLPEFSYEIELKPGEKLTVPQALADSVGPGQWVMTVRPAKGGSPIRDHSAFLKGYAPEDEGLYDERPSG